MSRDLSKRAQNLLGEISRAEQAGAEQPRKHATPGFGMPGLKVELGRMDKQSLDRLALLEARYAGGADVPCRKVDPKLVRTGGFFNRFASAFDPAQDSEFAALVSSVKTTNGNIEAGLVRPIPGPEVAFELVYGERRLRACALAGVEFKTLIDDALSDEDVGLLHIHENSHRQNPSAVESALQIASHLAKIGSNKLTPEVLEEIGKKYGVARSQMFRLRQIASVPTDVLSRIPGVRMISVRQGVWLAEAWKKDSDGVRERLSGLKDLPIRLPKDVISYLAGRSPTAPNGGYRSITLQWPKDPSLAKALKAKLREIQEELGVELGLPK